jgi:uncharacterized membrane protein YbhN (UPF0104 family)
MIAQLAILALIIWGSWRTVQQALADLEKSNISFAQFDLSWLFASGFFYLAGMVPFALFWHRVLRLMDQHPKLWNSLRAYFVSQPGKYVPGKFMVVVLRSACIRKDGVNTTLAVTSTFVETLTMMSVGAVLGAVILAVYSWMEWRLVAFALCMAFVVGLPVFPPVLRRVAKLTKLSRLGPGIDRSLEGLTLSSLVPGWVGIAVGWFSMGLSLWSTLKAMPRHSLETTNWTDIFLLTACIAMSTVAGFVSGLPGGLGVRELVVMVLVKPHFGAAAAVISAVVHRCVMIVVDLMVGGIMYAAKGRGSRVEGPEPEQSPGSSVSSREPGIRSIFSP